MYSQLGAPTTPQHPGSDPAGYIRQKWGEFEGLFPQLLDLQHRAAVVAAGAAQAGNTALYNEARATVDRLARNIKMHARIVQEVEKYSGFFGLGAITPAVALLAALAIGVAWLIANTAVEHRIVDGLESGSITAADVEALSELGSPPVELLGGVGELGKLALWGFLAFIAWKVLQGTGYAENPPLVVYKANPPGEIAEDVHAVYYRHAQDGDYYVHEFEGDVEMWGEDDGSVTLTHPTRRLWRDFR